jgi:hypothetical protein
MKAVSFVVAAALSSTCAAVQAADLGAPPPPAPQIVQPIAPPTWQFQATIYGWASGLDGSVGVGRLPSQDVNLSFVDLLQHLDGAFMGDVVAHNDTFLIGADLVWTRVGADFAFKLVNGPLSPLFAGTQGNLNQSLVIASAFGGYRIPIGAPNLALYGTVGARYYDISATVTLQKPVIGFSITNSQSIDWIDPTIGFAANYRFNEKWFLNALGDLGGFSVGSKISAQGLLAVGYNWTPAISTSLGYRALYVDYSRGNANGGSFRYDTTMQGPIVSATYTF